MPPHSHDASFREWIQRPDDSELVLSASGLGFPKPVFVKRRTSPPPCKSKMKVPRFGFILSLIFCGATFMLLAWPREGVNDVEEKWGPEVIQKSGRLLQGEESEGDGSFLGTYVPLSKQAKPEKRSDGKFIPFAEQQDPSTSLLSDRTVGVAEVPFRMLETEDVAGESHSLLLAESANQASLQDLLPDLFPDSNNLMMHSQTSTETAAKESVQEKEGKSFGTRVVEDQLTLPRKKLMMVTGVDSATCSTERGMEIGMKALQNKMDYAR